MVITHTDELLAVKDGRTSVAEIELKRFYVNNDETLDEAVLNALANLQAQLSLTISQKEVDNVIACATPILIDRIRSKKKSTASYRERNFSYK